MWFKFQTVPLPSHPIAIGFESQRLEDFLNHKLSRSSYGIVTFGKYLPDCVIQAGLKHRKTMCDLSVFAISLSSIKRGTSCGSSFQTATLTCFAVPSKLVSSDSFQMDTVIPAYRIFPIGDAAVTIDFGNTVDEKINNLVIQLFNQFNKEPLPAMKETVPAYGSITVYYDLFQLSRSMPAGKTVFDWMSHQLEERLQRPIESTHHASRLITIPVCYEREFAPDMEELAKQNKISPAEIIHLHSSKRYRVYMLGFLPGFSYMGETDERIAIPRKSQPQPVEAGSIGIAGKQTGIYPSASPGGWHIIGRTPVKLFDALCNSASDDEDAPEPFCLLKPGDTVEFISISKHEFENH